MSTRHTDGVMIDYQVGGGGEPLLLVHGSWVDRQTWGLVQSAVEACFTTIANSRRAQLRTTRVTRAERSVR
jgi:hypothetical protein